MLEERSFTNASEIQRQETKKAGAVVEEEHLLSSVDMCDNICMQVDIKEAYVSAPIVSIEYGFRSMTDDEDILD